MNKGISSVFPGQPVREVWWYAPEMLPAVVQTTDYTLAHFRRHGLDAQKAAGSDVSRWQDAILYGEDPPPLHILTAESFLRYHWGPAEDRQEQIAYLADLSRRRNVEIRLQQFIDGPAVPLQAGAAVRFPSGTTLFTLTGETDDPGIAGSYVKAFGEACDAALSPEDTTRLLDKLSKDTG